MAFGITKIHGSLDVSFYKRTYLIPILARDAFFTLLTQTTHLTPLLGIDFGTRHIGLSLADGEHTIASPLTTLIRSKWSKDAVTFAELFTSHSIGGIVLGWPLLMNGDQGPRCHSTRHFAENLLQIADLPLLLWDERTSSQASNRILEKEADLSRQKRRRVIDQTAATWILQGALEALRQSAPLP